MLVRYDSGHSVHHSKGGINGGTADFNCDDGVQGANCSLEWLQVGILVRKDTKHASVDTKTDTSVDILFRRFEPRISLSLKPMSVSYRRRYETTRTSLKM